MGNQLSMKIGGDTYCDCIEDKKKTNCLRLRKISFGAVIQKSEDYIEFINIYNII